MHIYIIYIIYIYASIATDDKTEYEFEGKKRLVYKRIGRVKGREKSCN